MRLALFAEMVKGKPWTPATLREVGGAAGVGVTFLEETFISTQANPRHRLHQKAAQAVLKALLPESGTDIKGQMRSEQELHAAAGIAGRPRDFHEVLHILDGELRLITPTDPEGSGTRADGRAGEWPVLSTDPRLPRSIPSRVVDQKTAGDPARAGGATLAERASLWTSRPENRHLPSIGEWANIRLLTRKRDWTDTQRRMMKRAGRLHGLRALGLTAVAAVLLAAGLSIRQRVVEAYRETEAHGLVQQLLKADTAQVPENIRALAAFRRWADPELKKAAQDEADGLEGEAARQPRTVSGRPNSGQVPLRSTPGGLAGRVASDLGDLARARSRSAAATPEAAGRSGGRSRKALPRGMLRSRAPIRQGPTRDGPSSRHSSSTVS